MPEIDKKPEFHACSIQIIEELRPMFIYQIRYRLQFYNDFPETDKIRFISLA